MAVPHGAPLRSLGSDGSHRRGHRYEHQRQYCSVPWYHHGDAPGVTKVHESPWTFMSFHKLPLPIVALLSWRHDVSCNFHAFIGGRCRLYILGRETLQGVHLLRRLGGEGW